MSSTNLHALSTRIKNPTVEAFGHALAGASAGAFALAILYPLDQIKVRKAVESQSRFLSPGIILDDFLHGRINNIMDIYRGLTLGIIQQFCFNGVYFFFYQRLRSDWIQKYSTPQQPNMPWLTALIRGSFAGLLTQLFTTPLKIIQLRKQTAVSEHDSSVSTLMSSIYSENGITGFWSGMKASTILVINPAIVQLLYGRIRRYLISRLGKKSAAIDFFAGALSKAVATVICYPLVLIKMNLQAGNGSSSEMGNGVSVIHEDGEEGKDEEKTPNGSKKVQFLKKKGPIRKRTSMSDIFESTMREKGIFGLYKGLGPKLVHSSLSNAIVFSSKEKFCV
eukprot:390545_1